MKMLVWNCRGLGNPRAVRALAEVVRVNSPQVVGLIETKLPNRSWMKLRCQLGFQNCFSVPKRGKSGGLAILWRDELVLEVQNFSNYHVDAVISGASQFRFTLFYGHPMVEKRLDSWNLLRKLSLLENKP
ncbi:hypothetical protein QQ045_018698 [Rhodiola kirilowii]